MDNPIWGDDWAQVRANWTLDPEVTFLNHGSFGATPRCVQDVQSQLRAEMERQPVLFLDRTLRGKLDQSLAAVGSLLGTSPKNLAFVPNATYGINSVVKSLAFGPGDELLIVEHGYGAIIKTLQCVADRTGAKVVLVPIPFPVESPDEIASVVIAALNERTRFVVIDQITSPTAMILPVKPIVDACRERGIYVMVDGAHAPGMLPFNLDAMAPDFWSGNLHKWVCAPKGAAVLYVRPGLARRIEPVVTSHNFGMKFPEEFFWTGTDDPTPYVCVRAAIEFMAGLGWARVHSHNHALARYGRRVVAEMIGGRLPVPDSTAYFGSMAIVEFPSKVKFKTIEEARAFQGRLYEQYRIEVPMMVIDNRSLLRLSAQVYNAPAQYERLGEALSAMLK